MQKKCACGRSLNAGRTLPTVSLRCQICETQDALRGLRFTLTGTKDATAPAATRRPRRRAKGGTR